MTDLPEIIYVGRILETVHDEISYRCDVEQISVNDTEYLKRIISKEEAREALAHFANVGWNEHCGLADKQDKEFMDKTIIKSLEQAAK
ncbi:MAG: hypothetical protein ACUZ8E_17685 [Candidatus Anammoxibacter sp.]